MALLAAGGLLLVLFVLVESRHRAPLLPLEVMRDRDRAASLLAVLVLATASYRPPWKYGVPA